MNNTKQLVEHIKQQNYSVVFLDIGKVLVNVDFHKENKLTAQHFNIDYGTYRGFIRTYFYEYITGDIESMDIDQLFTDQFEIEDSVTEYQQSLYPDTIELNNELLDQLDNLQQYSQLSIISNIFQDILDHLNGLGILDRFVHPSYSCKLGLSKPDSEIYYHALTKFADTAPGNCLLVDDKNHNLDTAREMGMDIYRYTKYI